MAFRISQSSGNKRNADGLEEVDEMRKFKFAKSSSSVLETSDTEQQRPQLRGNKSVIHPTGPPVRLPSQGTNVNDPDLLRLLRLDYTDKDQEKFQLGYQEICRERKDNNELVPPQSFWGCEDSKTAQLWREAFRNRKPKDGRPKINKDGGGAQQVHQVGPDDLEALESSQNVVIKDKKDGSIAGVMVWDFIPEGSKVGTLGHGLLQYINFTICGLGDKSRNARRDDLGKIIQLGYTGGSTGSPDFGWARNITTTTYRVADYRQFIHESTSIVALLWNDFDDTINQHNLPRMDWNTMGSPPQANISLISNGQHYELAGLDLGPPSALVGTNYAKITHKESNANQYMISLTTNRTAGADEGRHFVFSQYGLKVQNQTNTLLVHRVRDYHATLLPHRAPETENDRTLPPVQSGISLLIGASLPRTWAACRAKKEADEAKDDGKDVVTKAEPELK